MSWEGQGEVRLCGVWKLYLEYDLDGDDDDRVRLRKNERTTQKRTFLLGGDAIPDGAGALAELGLGAAELGEGIGEVGNFLRDLVFDLRELGGGDGGEVDCF